MEQNKTRTYILYAIGEIFLVVIGILIALQVNNWNLNQQAKAEEKRLLINVLQALDSDSVAFERTLILLNNTFDVYERLYEITQGRIPSDSLDNTYLLRRSIPISPVSINNYPDLASQVFDPIVKEAVLQYYSSLETWGYIQDNYNNFIEEEMRPFLGAKGMLNYGFHHQATEDPQNLLNNDALILGLDRIDVQQMLFEGTVKTRNIEFIYTQSVQRRATLINEINRVIQ